MALSPRVGVTRDSMLTNPRIMKAPLGKSKSRGFSVPGPDFTFGVNSSEDQGGVAQVLSSWRVVSVRGLSPALPPVVDFVALNRDAVKSGLVTAKELSQYRAQRPRAQPITVQQQRTRPIREQQRRGLVPDVTFGLINRPGSPLDLLMSHEYGQRWIQEQLKRNQAETERLTSTRVKLSSIPETRTSLLRKTQSLPQNQDQDMTKTKTTRYCHVGPALDSFRDPKFRAGALRAQDREAPSRRGQGQGVYNLD